jgi:hypothetical protein
LRSIGRLKESRAAARADKAGSRLCHVGWSGGPEHWFGGHDTLAGNGSRS